MEKELNRKLKNNETVDHIDSNPLNNDISNLRIIDRSLHCKNDVIRNKDLTVSCKYCKKLFTIKGSSLSNRNRKHSGYFCSKSCSGNYGKLIQLNKIKKEFTEKQVPTKYKLHKN